MNDEERRTGNFVSGTVPKLFQDVNTRWDSTCHMLIRALKLRQALNRYHDKHEAEYLRLLDVEWSQIEYLIDLTKLFCVFTKIIGQSKQLTIHQVFEIYNKLFDHLDQARARLSRKRVSWKRALLNGIEAAATKLRQYYSKTQGSLGYLYGKAALLSPNKKDLIFKGSNWDAPYGESRWEDQYWQSLEAEFDIYENSQTSQVRGRNIAVIRDLNNLDLLLSTNNATPLALDDEFNCYRQRGTLTDAINQVFSHCVQLIYNIQR